MPLVTPPETILELQERASSLCGKTLAQCARLLGVSVPTSQLEQKGWIGQLLEKLLGADAKNHQQPDFTKLGVELKTIPIGDSGRPSESTFVTTIQLDKISHESWQTSKVYQKLAHVLWVPIEDTKHVTLPNRLIGQPLLWQPSHDELQVLERDWLELVELITSGHLEQISGRIGDALHIRPKAANSLVLTKAYNHLGEKVKTLPRGFYLRGAFTHKILSTTASVLC